MNILLGILLILMVNLLFFWRTLSYGWVSDDIPANVKPLRQPKNRLDRLWMQFKCLGQFNSREAHWITLIIHTINCVLIFLAFGKGWCSLTASLLFAINPINMQGGSVWVSGKPYSTATLCALASYCIPILAPLFYASSALFSANAIFSAIPFFLTNYYYFGFLPLVLFGVFWKVIQKKWCLDQTSNIEMRNLYPRKIIPFFKTFGYYFRLCLMPYKLGLYHNFMWGLGVNKEYNKRTYRLNKDFWIGMILWFSCVIRIFIVRDIVSFGLFWFMVNISMWCNLVTIQQQVAERFVYLANVGLVLAMSSFILSLPNNVSIPILCIVITYYITRLWYYRQSYENDYWQLEYNLIEQKDAHYAWNSRGIKKFYVCDFDGALRDFGEARLHNKIDFKQNMNMASMFLALGDVLHAEEYLKYADETVYDGVEKQQRAEFVEHTRSLIEKMKAEGRIKIDELRIIK